MDSACPPAEHRARPGWREAFPTGDERRSGFRDDLGHTVWYTFQGTGGDVTVDTQGTNFDSVVAVYTTDGDTWTEVGCQDDVTLPDNSLSYQAILTVPTDAGVTYYIQAGGFRQFFDPDIAQSGRLRLAVNRAPGRSLASRPGSWRAEAPASALRFPSRRVPPHARRRCQPTP